MVVRRFREPNFRFEKDSAARLRQFVPLPSHQVDSYMRCVEISVGMFLVRQEDLRQKPVPSIKVLRETLTEYDKLAGRLARKLAVRDPYGDEGELMLALRWLKQPAGFLDDLHRQLQLLRQASQTALTWLPQPPKGPPARQEDTLLIAALALDYEHFAGKLPPAARTGWFCEFTDYLFSILPHRDETGKMVARYRLVGTALATIKGMRKTPREP